MLPEQLIKSKAVVTLVKKKTPDFRDTHPINFRHKTEGKKPM